MSHKFHTTLHTTELAVGNSNYAFAVQELRQAAAEQADVLDVPPDADAADDAAQLGFAGLDAANRQLAEAVDDVPAEVWTGGTGALNQPFARSVRHNLASP